MVRSGPRFSRRQFLALCGTTPLGGCSSDLGPSSERADWATVQYDPGHTGYLPDEEIPERGLVVGWDFETAHDELFYHPPTFADETVFAASPEVLYALDAEQGNVRWEREETTDADGDTVRFRVAEMVCGSDCVFVAWQLLRENDRLVAYDARSGERRWELKANTAVGAVLPVDDTLYAVATMSEGQRLLALDPDSGEVRRQSPISVESRPPLVYADGTLFSGDYRDIDESFMGWWTIKAFEAETGDQLWSTEVKGYRVGARSGVGRFFGIGSGGQPNLTAANGRVYFGTGPHELFALDAADGSKRWSYSLQGGRTDTGHAPVVDEDTVYVANLSYVTALDAETGEQRWQYDDARIPFDGYPEWYPILADDILLVPEQTTWLALDANTGEKIYRHGPYLDGLVGIAPLVVDGVLYTAVGDSVYAIGES